MPFILGYFQQKLMTNVYENLKKKQFWAVFAYFSVNQDFSGKSTSATFFYF